MSPKHMAWAALGLGAAMGVLSWPGWHPEAPSATSALPASAATGPAPLAAASPVQATAIHAHPPARAAQPALAPVAPAPAAQIALDLALGPPYPQLRRDDRTWLVLGTRVPDNASLNPMVVVLQDEKSGQLQYRQPALHFTLAPGQDYEAFIREHPQLRRRFVNALYAEAEVDAAQLAAQFSALSQDSRVSRVTLVPLRAPTALR